MISGGYANGERDLCRGCLNANRRRQHGVEIGPFGSTNLVADNQNQN